MLKVVFADQGTVGGLLANIDAIIADAEAKAVFGQALAEQYLSGGGPFPGRLAVSGLTWRFLWESNMTVLRWARWARQEVEGWPEDHSRLDPLQSFRRTVADASPLTP